MAKELSERVAIVTGGSGGLGRATAEKLLEDGARVVIADVNQEAGQALAAELGPDARYQQTDVSDQKQIEELVSFTVETFGGLHIMVNNAGVSGAHRESFLDEDLSDFHRIMSINLFGVMAGTLVAARHMAHHGGGSVINISSIGGTMGNPGVPVYAASKAGVVHFSRGVAIDLAEHAIRVNCIAPGGIPTGLLASATGSEEMTRNIRAIMAAIQPLRRQGTARDVAEAVAYLAGDRSLHVTGTLLTVDGGTSAGKMRPKNLKVPAPSAS